MKRKNGLWIWVSLAGIALFLCFPAAAGAGVRSGLALCWGVLIPSLFPVSVLAGCLIRMRGTGSASSPAERWMRALFRLPGAAALPFLLGLLGGFPLGARLAASLCREGTLTKQDAARLAGLSNNAGPGFLLGAAGTILGSPAVGMMLFGIQFTSAVLAGILLRGASKQQKKPSVNTETSTNGKAVSATAILPKSIADSALAMLRLTGAVAFFQAVSFCLFGLLPMDALPPIWKAFYSALVELAGGIALFRGISAQAVFPMAAALIGWGGLCVHLQAFQALSEAEIPFRPYLRHKFLQMLLAWSMGLLLFSFRG